MGHISDLVAERDIGSTGKEGWKMLEANNAYLTSPVSSTCI